jgi:hypothetical protein
MSEPLGRLPIKCTSAWLLFGVSWNRLWTAVCESLRGELRVSVEDHGEFGPVGFGVELPQKAGSTPSKRCITKAEGM